MPEEGGIANAGLAGSSTTLPLAEVMPKALLNASVTGSVGESLIGSGDATSMGIIVRCGGRRTAGRAIAGFCCCCAIAAAAKKGFGAVATAGGEDFGGSQAATVATLPADGSEMTPAQEPPGRDGPRPPTVLPSLILHPSGLTPVTPDSRPLTARFSIPFADRVLSADAGVPVAYRRPYTPPSPPVLPRRGSRTTAAVRRRQYPSSSKVKLTPSGGAS